MKEPPDPKRRRFYPTKKDIRNFLTRIQQLSHFTSAEEKDLKKLIHKIRDDHQEVNLILSLDDKSTNENDSSDEEFFEPEAEHSHKLKKEENRPKNCFVLLSNSETTAIVKKIW